MKYTDKKVAPEYDDVIKAVMVSETIEAIGDDPSRAGLKDTPMRVVKMWKEIFRGYDEEQKPNITVFDNGVDGVAYDQMVCDSGSFYSMCEHHMLPFIGKYWFAYIPSEKGKVLGLSKVARVVDYCSARLQVQERLTGDVLAMLSEALGDCEGIALCMEAEHLCKSMRGVKKPGTMRTMILEGVMKKGDARVEFLNYVNAER